MGKLFWIGLIIALIVLGVWIFGGDDTQTGTQGESAGTIVSGGGTTEDVNFEDSFEDTRADDGLNLGDMV